MKKVHTVIAVGKFVTFCSVLYKNSCITYCVGNTLLYLTWNKRQLGSRECCVLMLDLLYYILVIMCVFIDMFHIQRTTFIWIYGNKMIIFYVHVTVHRDM